MARRVDVYRLPLQTYHPLMPITLMQDVETQIKAHACGTMDYKCEAGLLQSRRLSHHLFCIFEVLKFLASSQ